MSRLQTENSWSLTDRKHAITIKLIKKGYCSLVISVHYQRHQLQYNDMFFSTRSKHHILPTKLFQVYKFCFFLDHHCFIKHNQ